MACRPMPPLRPCSVHGARAFVLEAAQDFLLEPPLELRVLVGGGGRLRGGARSGPKSLGAAELLGGALGCEELRGLEPAVEARMPDGAREGAVVGQRVGAALQQEADLVCAATPWGLWAVWVRKRRTRSDRSEAPRRHPRR